MVKLKPKLLSLDHPGPIVALLPVTQENQRTEIWKKKVWIPEWQPTVKKPLLGVKKCVTVEKTNFMEAGIILIIIRKEETHLESPAQVTHSKCMKGNTKVSANKHYIEVGFSLYDQVFNLPFQWMEFSSLQWNAREQLHGKYGVPTDIYQFEFEPLSIYEIMLS